MNGTRAVRAVALTETTAQGACPLCTVLRHHQTRLVEKSALRQVTRLCNHHAWSLARSAPAALAADVYRRFSIRVSRKDSDPKRQHAISVWLTPGRGNAAT